MLEASAGMLLSMPASTVLPVSAAPAKPVTSAAVLAAAVLASRKADLAIGGRLDRLRRPRGLVPAATPPSCHSTVPAAMAVPGGTTEQLSVPVLASSPASRRADDDVSLARSICSGDAGGCVSKKSICSTGASECVRKEGRLSYAEVVASAPASQPHIGRDVDVATGWQALTSRCRPRRSVPTLMPRPLPGWLRGRCCRCLFPGHRAAACRDPIRCSRCLRSGHRARECCNTWQPLSSLPGLVMSSQPQLVAHPCCGKKLVNPPSSLRRPTTPPPPGTTDVKSILSEEDMLLRSELKGCITRIESFLVRAGAALDKSLVVPDVSSLTELNVRSTDVGEEGLYGGFSPRSRPSPQLEPHVLESEDIATVMAPVMLIMPELQELCGESAPLSMLVWRWTRFGPRRWLPRHNHWSLARHLALLIPRHSLQRSFVAYSSVWRHLSLDVARRLLASYRGRIRGIKSRR
ncbi:hypothetical protein ACQ4PT_035860 [Festuca glaucescens]